MRPTLAAEVESFLRERGTSTAPEIAIGICARRDDVDEVLKSSTFRRVPAPEGCSPKPTYFNLSYLVPERQGGELSRAGKMLSVLRDGRPHSRQEIFETTGSFFLTNNAASELRRGGHTITQRRERGLVIYQLVGRLDEAAAVDPSAAPPAQSAAASSSPSDEPEAA